MKPWPPSADTTRLAMGAGLAIAIGLLIATILVAIWRAAGPAPSIELNIPGLLAGSLWQAGLTTSLSLGFGIGLAYALDRLNFRGRPFALALISAAIVAPGIIAAFAILSVWGRAGWVNGALEPFGLALPGTVFGLNGILLA
ncbi:MAG: hypothetical protein GXP01_02230, partial [Alphaproteobacteria bacterium]|nr:hypothetical protein [Alphaproteobacteria bacterium]